MNGARAELQSSSFGAVGSNALSSARRSSYYNIMHGPGRAFVFRMIAERLVLAPYADRERL